MMRFKRAAASLAEGFMTSRYQQALNHLSDGQLADLGLTRQTLRGRARQLARSR